MKKLLLLLAVLVAPATMAQEVYSISATAAQVTTLTTMLRVQNEQVCTRTNQALTCTQAQACVAGGAVGGSSCTAAQARAANVRIFPSTLAGREEFVLFGIAAPRFNVLKGEIVSWDQQRFCADWNASTQTEKDAVCSAATLPNGCELCP